MLFLRSFLKNKYCAILFAVVLIISSRIWEAQPLIVALPNTGFVDFTEKIMPFLFLLPISFLLYNNFEIELGLVNGTKTTRLMLFNFTGILFYAIVCMISVIAFYQYIPSDNSVAKIPIYIPEQYKLYMCISAFVVVLFWASIFLFIRVISRNCYVPIGLGLFVYTIFYNLNYQIHNGLKDIRLSLFDPFLSNYVLGDKVLTEYYRVGPLWTYNRVLFLGLAVLMLGITYVLLRRERLHYEN